MNDTVYRNASISEENLFPDRHPAGNKFDEWSDAMEEAGKMKKIKVGSGSGGGSNDEIYDGGGVEGEDIYDGGGVGGNTPSDDTQDGGGVV